MYELRAQPDSEIKVTECFFEAQELDDYPPRVDYDTVLWDDPDNEPYERYLRERNIRIPGQQSKESEAARANAMAIKMVCETMRSMLEQNRQRADKDRKMMREIDDKIQKMRQRVEPNMGGSEKSRTGDRSLEALRAGISILTEGAKAAVEIVKAATSK